MSDRLVRLYGSLQFFEEKAEPIPGACDLEMFKRFRIEPGKKSITIGYCLSGACHAAIALLRISVERRKLKQRVRNLGIDAEDGLSRNSAVISVKRGNSVTHDRTLRNEAPESMDLAGMPIASAILCQ